MTLEEAILCAHQKMREIGKKPGEYHYELVKVAPTQEQEIAGYFTVDAYNELYIAVNSQNFAGVFILADDNGYNSDIPLNCGTQEFTGKIQFKKIANNWRFSPPPQGNQLQISSGAAEFLRVVY